MWRAVRIAWEVLSLLLTSAIVGAGIGFLEGEIVTRSWSRHDQIAFAEGSALMGTLVALFVGPVLYLLLGRRITFGEFARIVACGAIAGALAALVRWEFIVPIAVVLASAGAALVIRAMRPDH